MKNKEKWRPSKFIIKNGKLIASRDKKEVGVASRLAADLTASFLDRAIKLHAKGKLLDLGCGKVPLFDAYKVYITDNICVDWENTSHKNEYIDYPFDISKGLPFENNTFDTIILSDVLEHISQPELLWKEMYRVLAADGKLILSVPFYYWIHEQPHDYYRYTEFALKRFADNAGFSLIELEIGGGSPEILADLIAKNVKSIPLVGDYLAIFFQYITSVFVKTSWGRKISTKTSKNFPFGYYLVATKAPSSKNDATDSPFETLYPEVVIS